MKAPSQMSRTATLVEGALMVALAFVLSLIPGISLPLGGTISWFSTLPILVMSLRHSTRWGFGTALVYGFAQMLAGMQNVLFLKTLGPMVLCALLDYLLAYACLGFCGPIARRFSNGTAGLVSGIAATGLMRFLCSFLSGIILYGQYAAEGTPVWLHSIVYNGSWCLPDVALVLAAALLLSRVPALHLLRQPQAKEA